MLLYFSPPLVIYGSVPSQWGACKEVKDDGVKRSKIKEFERGNNQVGLLGAERIDFVHRLHSAASLVCAAPDQSVSGTKGLNRTEERPVDPFSISVG